MIRYRLLSVYEATKLPLKIRKFVCIWSGLRSPGYNSNNTANVINDGVRSNGSYVNDDSGSVRPTMRVKIEDLD